VRYCPSASNCCPQRKKIKHGQAILLFPADFSEIKYYQAKPMTTATASATTLKTDLQSHHRINSVDILRGAIMVLMAIDHVRVYAGLPAGGPEPGIFFTRWITHFCAPGFAFFAGTSAFLYGIKLKDSAKLAKYLATRGLMLVVMEVTLIKFLWAFNLDYSEFILAGVIWMLGWCMILLAAVIRMRAKTIGIAGVAIILLQQAFALPSILTSSGDGNAFTRFWEFIYSAGFQSYPAVTVLYVIVPWIGVMMAGYGFGEILLKDGARRKKICLTIGGIGLVLYLIVGTIAALVSSPDGPPFIFKLLNQQKYPASQLFLLMTLSPMILLVPYLEKARGSFANALSTIGRVPFFYYLCHILVIHLSALIVNQIRTGDMHNELYRTAPYTWFEEGRWSLGLLYATFAIDVVILFTLCKWYASYKANHPEKAWLKYL
jgi:uncharacterized membrane protein